MSKRDRDGAAAALALLALAVARSSETEQASELPAGWGTWPMPSLSIGGRLVHPVVSDQYGWSPARGRLHAGVDITYPTRGMPLDYVKGLKRPYDISRGGGFAVPPGVPILASRHGTVWDTNLGGTRRGQNVMVVHDGGTWATWYQHLESLERPWRRGDVVPRGTWLGPCGYDLSGQEVRHLHFELWRWDRAAKKWSKQNPGALAGWTREQVLAV